MVRHERVCSACNRTKHRDEYRFDNRRNQYRADCRECEGEKDRERKAKRGELARKYREWIYGRVLDKQDGACSSCGRFLEGMQQRETWSDTSQRYVVRSGLRCVEKRYAEAIKARINWEQTKEGTAAPTKRYVDARDLDNATRLSDYCVKTHDQVGAERDQEIQVRVKNFACLCSQCWQRWVRPGGQR